MPTITTATETDARCGLDRPL